jgi:VanZ family protein
MRTFLKPLSFIPALVLMYMIFSFSAQDAETSSEVSYQVSYQIVKTADQILDADLQEWEMQSLATRFNGVTRKIAHMTEYFALAIAVSFPLYVYGMHGFLLMLSAGLICVAFACGDEYHQSFVSGRGPSVRDVLIDSFGVFWGIVLVRIIGWTGRMTIFRSRKKKKKKRRNDSYSEYQNDSQRREYSEYPQDYRDSKYNGYQQDYRDSKYDGYQQDYRDSKYDGYQQSPYRYESYSRQEVEEAHVSDKLSEDMSFKKLMHDIREQHRSDKQQND